MSKSILVASLDWGLGHTTRCIPTIRHLLSGGHHVVFAGNGMQRLLVRAACPGVDEAELPGYGVSYSRRALMAGLVAQLPKMALAIRRENHWLRDFVKSQPLHGVISDNRYGLHHPSVPCAILTHQLNIRTGMGRLADSVVRKQHDRMLGKFGETWIVDDAKTNLAGTLSKRDPMPSKARWLGLLSQCVPAQSAKNPTPEKQHILILLSGPEPQRTLLSDLLWQQALTMREPIVFVEGNRDVVRNAPPHIHHIPIAQRDAVPQLMAAAKLVVCRSGYSTMMDLAALQAPAALIPTPGQTEQEYLAGMAQERGWALTATQQDVNLEALLGAASGFSFQPMAMPEAFAQHQAVLDEWVARL